MERLIGRHKEKKLLQEAIVSGKPELIALLDKAYADNLENKRDVFREQTKKESVYLMIVPTISIKNNEYSKR